MASTSVTLDIRANTTRALNEFKKFSAQLDNKFLVSGLKLDVVRSALGQINREFQRAIGQQGLQAGQSLRAAQNQAALIVDTFKNVGTESSIAITEQFSAAFSQIAVTAGGTAKDIQKALGATSFISTNLPEELRKKLGEGILAFQRDARRAGLGNNYAELVQEFLAGQVTARELIQSGKPLESALGAAISRTSSAGGTIDEIVNPEQRSRIVAELQNSSQLRDSLRRMIARADWGFTVIEDLNAFLFNPERGVFGVLREVTMSIGDKTTVFRETRELVESVFGRQGLFVTFFQQIGKIFGIEDPLKVVIRGVRWLTRQFNSLREFLLSPPVQSVVQLAREVVKGVVSLFTNLYNGVREFIQGDQARQISENFSMFFTTLSHRVEELVRSEQMQTAMGNAKKAFDNIIRVFTSISSTFQAGDWDPSEIDKSIRTIGEDIRAFIRNVGKGFREADIAKEGEFIKTIIITIVQEISKTIGALAGEIFSTVFSSKGGSIFLAMIEGITKILGGLISEGGIAGTIIAGIVGKRLVLGVVGFVSNIIKALPGGRALNTIISRRINAALRSIPIIGGLFARRREPRVDQTISGARNNQFQVRVINRLDTLIRCLCGINPPSRVSRNGPQGSVVRQRARNIARIRAARRGGLGAVGSRIAQGIGSIGGLGGRVSSAWSALPGWGKLLVGGGASLLTVLGMAGAGRSSELPEDLQTEMTQQQKDQLKLEQRRESTRGALGLGLNLAGGLAGGKLGSMAGFSVGGPWGAAIGGLFFGILGSIAGDEAVKALSDPIIDGISKLGDDIGKGVTDAWNNAGVNFNKVFQSVSDSINSAITNVQSFDLGQAIRTKLQETASGLGGIRDETGKIFSNAISNFSGAIEGLKNWLGGFIPGIKPNFAGMNFIGPTLAQEARNSGSRALVVNSEEFVIPSNGFSTLANLVEQRISPRIQSSQPQAVSAQFNVNINVSGGLNANNVDELRGPIISIINDAWKEATVGVASRGSII